MYKTVRHGENSLQYTILPQTEEVLCNSGLKGKGRDYSPSIHVRRSRKGYSLQCVLLVVLLTIIAVLVGAYSLCYITTRLNSHEIRQNRLEVITSVPLTPTGREIMKSRKKELKMTPDVISIVDSKRETSSSSTTTSTSTIASTVTIEKSTTPPWTMPALRSWKSSTPSTTIPPIPTEDNNQIPLVGTPSGSIRLLDHYAWKPVDVIIKPTVTPEPMTVRNIFRQYSNILYNISSEKPVNKFEDVLITTRSTTVRTPVTTDIKSTTENSKMRDLKDTILSVDDDDEFKESLEVDEVFSLPTVTAEGVLGSDSDEVTVSKAGENGWYGARWPFVDTSSYFQWTGYSPGDNLLLPLLVAALSSIALVLLLALAVKRRKRSHTATASIGLTADLQADDNTNLLTAENPEDMEE